MFVVFKATETSQYKAIYVDDDISATEIDYKVKGVNWYGCKATTEQEAIKEAIANNFKYISKY